MGAGVLADAAYPPAWLGGLLDDAGLDRAPDGELRMDGVRLSEVAETVRTPAYVYGAGTIRRQFRRLEAALAGLPHRVHFAVKANGNLAVLRVLRELGAGADIVSIGELHRAMAAGFSPADIVYSGVGKTAADLAQAAAVGVGQVNVESLPELERLAAVVRATGRTVAVGIRVNPDVTADTHPYIATGSSADKFGIPLDQVVTAARLAASSPGLELTALAMHLGSQLVDPAPFAAGIDRLLALLDQLRAHGIRSVRTLDVGGGLGIRYRDEAPLPVEAYGALLAERLGGTGLTVAVEPGRYLVGSAGVLLAEVVYRKHAGGKEFVIVDAAMNDLLRPSHYDAWHEVVPVVDRAAPALVADVVGPVCESGDFLALGRTLPAVQAGERVAVLGAGAYGFTMASNYNTRPLPPEVLVDGGRWGVARPRQLLSELYAAETADPIE